MKSVSIFFGSSLFYFVIFSLQFVVGFEGGQKTLMFENKTSELSRNVDESSEEYKRFQIEVANQPKRRSKRFVIFNTEAQFAIGLLISFPVALALPSMSNAFNQQLRRRRSLLNEDDEDEVFEDHPMVKPHLERVGSYFELIDIPDHSCQVRAVCEFSAEPQKYYPISELVLNRLRNPHLHAVVDSDIDQYAVSEQLYLQSKQSSNLINQTSTTDVPIKAVSPTDKPQSLFKVFNKAADQGQAYGHDSCQEKFNENCKYSMEKLLNLPVLQYWSALSSLLKFSLKDSALH